MSALVFRSGGGRKYHADRKCPALARGQAFWDRTHLDPSEDGYCTPLDVWGSTPDYSAGCGRLPCLACVPPELRVFPPLYGQTFGHRPITGFVDGRGLADVCARCETYEITWWGNGFRMPVPVRWPCTSAIVLGLVPRQAVSAP